MSADSAYESYEAFENNIRIASMPISEYILNFERLYNKAAKHGMALPDTVRAFKLLKCLNLPDSERRMVLSSCKDLKYDDIKSALKKNIRKFAE